MRSYKAGGSLPPRKVWRKWASEKTVSKSKNNLDLGCRQLWIESDGDLRDLFIDFENVLLIILYVADENAKRWCVEIYELHAQQDVMDYYYCSKNGNLSDSQLAFPSLKDQWLRD